MEKNCKYEEEELLEKEFQSQVMNMKQKYSVLLTLFLMAMLAGCHIQKVIILQIMVGFR